MALSEAEKRRRRFLKAKKDAGGDIESLQAQIFHRDFNVNFDNVICERRVGPVGLDDDAVPALNLGPECPTTPRLTFGSSILFDYNTISCPNC